MNPELVICPWNTASDKGRALSSANCCGYYIVLKNSRQTASSKARAVRLSFNLFLVLFQGFSLLDIWVCVFSRIKGGEIHKHLCSNVEILMALLGKPVVCFGEMEDLLLSLLGRFCISHFSLSSNCKHSDTKRLYSHLLCLFTVWPASCMSEFTFKCKLPFLKGAAVTSFRCELSCFWVGCHVCFETNFIFTFSRPT